VGTPVLVREGSEVVTWHCERSGGGRVFADGADLAGVLRELVASPELARALAEGGRRYVLDTYRWPVVLDRMEASLDEVVGAVRAG
jgi:glycosyltransferase involved in cell wall biosynthesis